jgi:hypothetical protein
LLFVIAVSVSVIVGFILCLLVLSFCDFHCREPIFTNIRFLLGVNQTQYSETHTASRRLKREHEE